MKGPLNGEKSGSGTGKKLNIALKDVHQKGKLFIQIFNNFFFNLTN